MYHHNNYYHKVILYTLYKFSETYMYKKFKQMIQSDVINVYIVIYIIDIIKEKRFVRS